MEKIEGLLVDVFRNEIYPARVSFGRRIRKIERLEKAPHRYIVPGFVDAHIHVESSMLIPSEFARLAVRHGTVAVVSDPHEIANVLGLAGVKFMMGSAKKVPLRFYFGAPSCVPATEFETAGARLGPGEVRQLLSKKEVLYLSEVMNYPGVISREPEVMEKIEIAKKMGKRIDGHAPGLRGSELDLYISAGIETDHECYMLEEAREKMRKGMKIIVREGSAAKNLQELYPILEEGTCMLCSDDRHPDDLIRGHVNEIVSKAVSLGVEPITAIRSATRNVVEHYGLGCGLLRIGDSADFAVLEDLRDLRVLETRIAGERVFSKGKVLFRRAKENAPNNFKAGMKKPGDFAHGKAAELLPVICAVDGSLITEKFFAHPGSRGLPDVSRDVLKIAVVNRYADAVPAVAFARNFGIKKGAFGSSVAHDSHNVCVAGTSDDAICRVANEIIRMRGGLAAYDGKKMLSLPLPVAGLMSGAQGETVASKYGQLTGMVNRMGSKLRAPFMTLSFMALLVMPHIKISDRGLFDGDTFRLVK